jgi:hypothetical protein
LCSVVCKEIVKTVSIAHAAREYHHVCIVKSAGHNVVFVEQLDVVVSRKGLDYAIATGQTGLRVMHKQSDCWFHRVFIDKNYFSQTSSL